MHELTATESLLQLALCHAGGNRVTDLYLVVGQLSSMVDDSVQFYWDIISEGTPAEGARLHFRRIPAAMQCLECGQTYGLGGDDLACPYCGSTQVRLASGDEFYLEAIEIEHEREGQTRL